MDHVRYPHYTYLHQNGVLVDKNKAVVDADSEYFDSPLVVKWWLIEKYEDFEVAREFQRKYKEEKGIK